MSLKEDIKIAVEALSCDDNSHWTAAGLPSVEAVNMVLGDDEKVTRAMINEACPGVMREVQKPVIDEEIKIVGESEGEIMNPIQLMEEFSMQMQADGGKWMRYCPPLATIWQQYMANKPSIDGAYARAHDRGRL